MFEVKLDKAATLKKVVESIKDLVNTANFECKSTSVTLRGMDFSHVALIYLVMGPEFFSNFRCDADMTLGINLNNFNKLLKAAANDDSVAISSIAGTNRLKLGIIRPRRHKNISFQLKLLKVEPARVGAIPNSTGLNYAATIEMQSTEFMRICKDLAPIGENLTLSVLALDGDRKRVSFSVEGPFSDAVIELDETSISSDDQETASTIRQGSRGSRLNELRNEESSVKITMSQPISREFAIRFLLLFSKATVLSEKVVLKVHRKLPLSVSYQFEGNSVLEFFLASKLNNE